MKNINTKKILLILLNSVIISIIFHFLREIGDFSFLSFIAGGVDILIFSTLYENFIYGDKK